MSDLIVNDSTPINNGEIDVQIRTAKAYPRDIKKFLNEAIEMATYNEEIAASCIYSVPRGKGMNAKMITGGSVRLAEILMNLWGNIHLGSRTIDNDGKNITAEGVAWDLEKNNKVIVQTKRSIRSSDGKVFGMDMQNVTGKAAESIAMRNAIFKIIPGPYVKEVYSSAVKFSVGSQEKLIVKVEKLINRFQALGIDRNKIFSYFGKSEINEITSQEVEEMIGLGTAIKENHLKIEDAFKVFPEIIENSAKMLNEKLSKKTNEEKLTYETIPDNSEISIDDEPY